MPDVAWGEALAGAFVPRLTVDRASLTTLIAVLGTTISPYLFFWQAAEEFEHELGEPDPRPLREHPRDTRGEMQRIGLDTWVSMTFSNTTSARRRMPLRRSGRSPVRSRR